MKAPIFQMIGFYNKLKMGIDMIPKFPPAREHVEPPQPWPTPEQVGKKFDGDKPMMSLVEPKFIEEGLKYDSGKLEYNLIPPEALEDVIRVLMYGKNKYAENNWRHVDNGAVRYFNAAQRHLWEWQKGVINDSETGLNHLSHAICNLIFLHEITKCRS